MKRKLIALLVGMSSVSAMAWQVGDFDGQIDIGGTIEKEQFSQQWQWRVGNALSFNNNWNELTGDGKDTLILRVTEPKGLLYGETVKAIDTGGHSSGALPQIKFADFENNPVELNQDDSSANGTGYLTLPITKVDDNSQIGNLKVNVTSIGIAVGQDANNKKARVVSLKASGASKALYGGLFSKSFDDGYSDSGKLSVFGAKNRDQLLQQLQSTSSLTGFPGGWHTGSWSQELDFTHNSAGMNKGIASVSYVLGVEQGQTLDATFTAPITSTTEWSAPLKVSVTYN